MKTAEEITGMFPSPTGVTYYEFGAVFNNSR